MSTSWRNIGAVATSVTSLQTTGDVYADWDIDQPTGTMADVLADDDEL